MINMKLTKRQEEILNRIVEDYIELAEPISSELLDKKHKLEISSATVRIEFQKLTKKGYLRQPHTSAGRVPTDKGYRFFVDNLLERKFKEFQMNDWFSEDLDDTVRFMQELTDKMASMSKLLVLGYLKKADILWKEGWEEILQEPEFLEKEYIQNFTKLSANFEKRIEGFKINSGIRVYIGKENPFSKTKEFSTIISQLPFPDGEKGIISFLGPKRMDYEKNINLINSLKKILSNW